MWPSPIEESFQLDTTEYLFRFEVYILYHSKVMTKIARDIDRQTKNNISHLILIQGKKKSKVTWWFC